jgi:hypothetical protein
MEHRHNRRGDVAVRRPTIRVAADELAFVSAVARGELGFVLGHEKDHETVEAVVWRRR